MKLTKIILTALFAGALLFLLGCPASTEGGSETTPETENVEIEAPASEVEASEGAISDAVDEIVEEGNSAAEATDAVIKEITE